MSDFESSASRSSRVADFKARRAGERHERLRRGKRQAARAFFVALSVTLFWKAKWLALGSLTNPFDWGAAEAREIWSVGFLLVLPVLWFVLALAAIPLLVIPKTRARAAGALPAIAVGVLAFDTFEESWREALLEEFVRDTTPFVTALETYAEEHQQLPADFELLVPDYVDRLPSLPPLRVVRDQPGDWRLEFVIVEQLFMFHILALRSEATRESPYGRYMEAHKRIGPWEILYVE